MTRRYIRSKRSVDIRGLSEKEAERLRGEFKTAPAAIKVDDAIVNNAAAASIPSHSHAASDISDFNTQADARITAATGVSVEPLITAATGWSAATGTATRTTFATSTVTTEQLAERVKALIDDLTTKGLIGS